MVQVRKLVRAGPSSYTVSLPKDWVEKNGLTKGSPVYVTERSDYEVVISPHLAPASAAAARRGEVIINVDGKAIDSIHREITAAYVNNAGTITLIGDDVQKKGGELRRVLHDFVALEIAEQTGKRMVAKDLLNLSEVGIDNTLRRMDMIVRAMLQDLAGGKPDEVRIRDYDMNRLYFLLRRLARAALKDKAMAEHLHISAEQTLGIWTLAEFLESTADAIKSAAQSFPATQQKKHAAAIQELLRLFEQAMASWFATPKDKAKADRVVREVTKLNLPEHLHSIARGISAIARLVIDEA